MNGRNSITVIQKTNEAFAGMLNRLSAEQLNAVPAGFNNNIIWNFAHSFAMQQEYFYRYSGLGYTIDKAFINLYKKGTKPETKVTGEEINDLISRFANAINQFETDYREGAFKTYLSYTTSIGFTITNIESAMEVALFHDGWHFGCARALKRLVLIEQGV